MKLKVLSMCAIASLLYGENVFADEVQSQENLNGKNTIATQDKNSGVSKDINHNTNITNGPSAMSWKNAKRNRKKRRSPIDNSQISHTDQNLDNGIAGDKKLTRSSSLPDLTNFQKPETAEPTVLDALNEFPINGSKGSSSFSDSRADTESKEKADAVAQSLSEFKSDLNYKEMADTIEKLFSEFKDNFNNFKMIADSFLNNVLDNQNLSVEERKNSASFFNKAKESVIAKIDHLKSVLSQAKEILKIFEDLKIGEKNNIIEIYEEEIEKWINDINEKRKSQKREKKLDKQANKQIIGEIDWTAIDKYTENLSKFALKARDFKFKFGDIMYYGKMCFENQDGSMFNPRQEMDPSLRSLCTQIFKVHFPAARNAYLGIKNMTEKAKTKEVLEDFRSKILALGGSVESLIKQRSNIDVKKRRDEENKKKMEEAIKRENLGEGNGYEE
ncbi:MAG: hypothetical protein K5780_03545 [Alphaproteobacteria bacterium]|nr:hypothetical protein [Alphaproteobacteria bacterium]